MFSHASTRTPSGFAIALLGLSFLAGGPAGSAAGETSETIIAVEAVNELKAAAGRGDPSAMLKVAQFHEQGVRAMDGALLIPRDFTEAFKLYLAAAEGDLIPEALFAAGCCYEMGLGVAADLVKAGDCYQKAVKLNYPPALLKMAELLMDGRMFQKDVERGLAFMEAAFRAGNDDAAHQLALVHLRGRFGKAVDAARGAQWLAEAAARGHRLAIQGMAELRQAGAPGVLERDTGEAMKWYLILAKTGSLSREAAQRAQALRNGMTQAEAQAADDNAIKWLRELESAQARSRDEAQQAAEQRFAAFNKAVRPAGK